MGLRERKAARTRAQIVDVAVETFLAQGYDETTMEQIAEAAEVGTSTLYRYFPSKDLLILDRLIDTLDLAHRLRERPADEPPDVSLGAVLTTAAEQFGDPALRIPELRRVIDAAPVPRARLWDLVLQSRADFEGVLAERMGLPADDISVRFTAGITLDVFQVVDEERKRDPHRDYADVVRRVLERLQAANLLLPAAGTRVA